jgi:hypothetical protein
MLNQYLTGSMQILCPQCGVGNELTAISLPLSELVECSKCRSFLGNWESLERVLLRWNRLNAGHLVLGKERKATRCRHR